MGRGSREDGAKARRTILAELVRRWENMEPELSAVALAAHLGMDRTSLRYHVRLLRKSGYIHNDGLVCTALGYREIRGISPLTS